MSAAAGSVGTHHCAQRLEQGAGLRLCPLLLVELRGERLVELRHQAPSQEEKLVPYLRLEIEKKEELLR